MADLEKIKILPQDPELESVVLGALLIEADKIYDVANILKPDVFYKTANKIIYSVIESMFRQHLKIDTITVRAELIKRNQLDQVGGEVYLTSLTERVATALHVQEHSQRIYEKYLQRELIKFSRKVEQKTFANDCDIQETFTFCEAELMNITNGVTLSKEAVHISEISRDSLDSISEIQNSEDKQLGIPSGITDIVFYPSDLIIFAARPAMGKTYISLEIAKNIAMYNVPVAFFSLEMSQTQVGNRVIALQTNISSEKFRKATLNPFEWTEAEKAQGYFEKLPLFIDDESGINVQKLVSKIRKLIMIYGVKVAIIDYLQLIRLPKSNKTDDSLIGEITFALKCCAKELSIPIILLSQLNREVEKRHDKRPKLSDLRSSGNIEQDADEVYSIFRPYYYTKNSEDSGIIDIEALKSRHGKLFTSRLHHNEIWTKFSNVEFARDEVDDVEF